MSQAPAQPMAPSISGNPMPANAIDIHIRLKTILLEAFDLEELKELVRIHVKELATRLEVIAPVNERLEVIVVELIDAVERRSLVAQLVRGIQEMRSTRPDVRALATELGLSSAGGAAPSATSAMPTAVKDNVIRFNERFVERRKQFRYLSGFKKLHEGLHNLQSKREAISQAAERFKQNPANSLEIDMIGDDLKEDYESAVKSTASLEDPADADWVEPFGRVVTGLKDAVTRRDLNALTGIVEALRTLPNQQAGLNSDLVRCARRLKPLELVDLMDTILAGLGPSGASVPAFMAEFRERLNRFRALCDRLSRLISDHDNCQRIETSLAQAETAAVVTPDRVPSWESVKADLQAIASRRPDDTLAVRVAQIPNSFESTAKLSPNDPKPAGDIFANFVDRFRRLFHNVDEELLAITSDLVQEAAYLDVQLRTATHVN
ncbi:MAG: hypothetical protein ACHRXM_37760 [Isosphaerales bacterium]